MTIGTLIFFGFLFVGGLILWVFFNNPVYFGVIAAAFLLYFFHTVMSNTKSGEGISFRKRPLRERMKPYSCEWCNKCFWTCKGCVQHEEVAHPVQRRNRIAYYKAQEKAQHNNGKKIHNPEAYLKPCTWCGGSGWKNGVMCDECGGTGKMFR